MTTPSDGGDDLQHALKFESKSKSYMFTEWQIHGCFNLEYDRRVKHNGWLCGNSVLFISYVIPEIFGVLVVGP